MLREELGGAYVDMQDDRRRHGRAAQRVLRASSQDVVRFGAEVRAIEQDAARVTVALPDRAGHGVSSPATTRSAPCRSRCCGRSSIRFSREKERAIRQLNYHASTKILLQVRDRFWETEDGIVGGGASVTDLPIRRMNYPPDDPTTSRGVLLASYTWGQDALQWGAMDEETRIEEALDDVAQIHPRIREEFEVGASHAWYGDRWARGAFALFAPEQQTQLQSAILQPEGRVYFAGRALLALPRVDPGRARVGHPRGAARSTSSLRELVSGRRARPYDCRMIEGASPLSSAGRAGVDLPLLPVRRPARLHRRTSSVRAMPAGVELARRLPVDHPRRASRLPRRRDQGRGRRLPRRVPVRVERGHVRPRDRRRGPEATEARPDRPIRVGVGIHAGEAVETPDGFIGSAVNMASRVCAAASPGEVLVTDTVRGITQASIDVGFASRGKQRLKGMNEPVELFAVTQGASTASATLVDRRWARGHRARAPSRVMALAFVAWSLLPD